ncbi:MAG: arylsulfatase [Acidobacteria bacterium]|nr:arylsulfatase [Acidobacteriota bacterium]
MLIRLVTFLALTFPILAAAPPNIVFILADDMGYGDVQALNLDSHIPTPNLDRLSRQGMTFTDAHTPSAVCTPTRYGLLTGRYAWRGRLTKGVLNGYGEPLIESGRPTVASFLQRHGYHTGMVGKWHLGLGFAKTADGAFDFSKPVTDGPHTRGFDDSFIIPASLDFPPYVYIRNGVIERFPLVRQAAQKFPAFLREGERQSDLIMENVLDELAREAGRYIKQRASVDRPFFLYLALTAPHKPVLPHPRFRGSTALGPYGDFVTQVDATVGDVLKALDDSGARDNTLVIYSSDNGSFMYRLDDDNEPDHVDDETIQAYRANRHRANHVFRGTKADIWEAGHHVPFFARWPGTIEPGSRNSSTICLTDFFSTVAGVIGREPPDEGAEDSFSFLPQLRGEKPTAPRPPVMHHSVDGMFAIRDGDWKLVLGNGSGGREKPAGAPFQKPYQLFDLSADPSEHRNVIEEHPEIAVRLEQAVDHARSGSHSR